MMSERAPLVRGVEAPIEPLEVWGKILAESEVELATGRIYKPGEHGVTPVNQFVVFPPVDLEPLCGALQGPEVFAMGSAFYSGRLISLPAKGEDKTEEDWRDLIGMFAPALTYQPRLPGFAKESFREVVESELADHDAGLFCLVDFECLPSPENLKRITGILSKSRFDDWYLFDSGGSYHLVLGEAGLSGPQLIQTYGELIEIFAAESPEWKRLIVESFARDFIEGAELMDIYGGEAMMRNEQRVIKACQDILKMVGHIDEPASDKITFTLDLRFIAYAVLEAIDFDNGVDESFPALRITKGLYSQPPNLIAISEERNVTIFEYGQPQFARQQQRLPEI